MTMTLFSYYLESANIMVLFSRTSRLCGKLGGNDMQRIFISLTMFGALTAFNSTPQPFTAAVVQQEFPKFCMPGCQFDEMTQRCYCQI